MKLSILGVFDVKTLYYSITPCPCSTPFSFFWSSFSLLPSSSTGLPEPRLDWNVWPWPWICIRDEAFPRVLMARVLAGGPSRFARAPAQSPGREEKRWFLSFSASSRYGYPTCGANTQPHSLYPASGRFLVKYDRTEVNRMDSQIRTEFEKIVPSRRAPCTGPEFPHRFHVYSCSVCCLPPSVHPVVSGSVG